MPSRYSEETRRELERLYLLGAEKVVAHRGWEAGTVREIAKVLEISRGPIHEHFKGLRLKKALIAEAYLHLSRAILLACQKPGTLEDFLQVVINHLRHDREAAPLMVQVAALAAADEAPDGGELTRDIIVARVGAAKFIEQQIGERLGHNSPARARHQIGGDGEMVPKLRVHVASHACRTERSRPAEPCQRLSLPFLTSVILRPDVSNDVAAAQTSVRAILDKRFELRSASVSHEHQREEAGPEEHHDDHGEG